MITGSQIEEFLSYEPETGNFYWKKQIPGSGMVPGGIAGSNDNKGYRRIGFAGKTHKAHRLAWVYMYGRWPSCDLDHINGDPADNRIANLRLATRSQNLQNRSHTKTNKSGFKGVSWSNSRRKWYATIRILGKGIHLGSFDDPKEAHAAYREAAQRLFGEFARVA